MTINFYRYEMDSTVNVSIHSTGSRWMRLRATEGEKGRQGQVSNVPVFQSIESFLRNDAGISNASSTTSSLRSAIHDELKPSESFRQHVPCSGTPKYGKSCHS